MESENTENPPSEEAKIDGTNAEPQNELDEPRWSVVSFDKCVAENLTYEQAAQKIAELTAQKVSGLCIITDEAASRIKTISTTK